VALSKVLIPVSRWFVPLWTWFNATVPLEYRLALVFLVILFFIRRIDPFVKTNLSVFLSILLLYRWLSPVLTNNYVKFFSFVIVPTSLSVHALSPFGHSKASPDRFANLLLYIAGFPWLAMAESRMSVTTAPIVGLLATPGLYAFLVSWLYWIDADWFSRDLRYLVNRTGFIAWMAPALRRLIDLIRKKIPVMGRLEQRFNRLRQSITMSSLALFGAQNASMAGKIFAFIKSTPLIALIVILLVISLGILYWLHSAMSSLFVLALWPWWFLDTMKVCMYERKEDYKGQLAFSLLFLALEVFLVTQKRGFLPFVLNLFHLPLIIAIKMAPLFLVQLLSKLVSFVPVIVIRRVQERKPPAIEAKPIEETDSNTVSSVSSSLEIKRRRSSSMVKRRSTGTPNK
jgi:hypothetical protein